MIKEDGTDLDIAAVQVQNRVSAAASKLPVEVNQQGVTVAKKSTDIVLLISLISPNGTYDDLFLNNYGVLNIQDELGITFVVVTHDQEEAMTLSGRIAVMDKGQFQQIGTPKEIYEFPNNRFVADFIGTINTFEGVVTVIGDEEIQVYSDEAGEVLQRQMNHRRT